jgi:hypothetical protein
MNEGDDRTGAEELIRSYLLALEANQAGKILAHFSLDAEIVSPTYGRMAAAPFYEQLCADTSNVEIFLREISESRGRSDLVFAHFDYRWTLKDGSTKNLEIMDLFKLEGGKIKSLRIFADGRK